VISIVIISKDEPELGVTLDAVAIQCEAHAEVCEIVVVDASAGRLDEIRRAHPAVTWIDFVAPPEVRISIPHQRNRGVQASRGETIVYVDSGCRPRAGWLDELLAPLHAGESVVAGLAVAPAGADTHYQLEVERVMNAGYLTEAPTINLAFRRAAFGIVGGFDERFAYGSDIDFTWRLVDHGFAIRSASGSIVEHDWGGHRRQVKRAFQYGQARAQLYRKHVVRRRQMWRTDPVVLIYPLFLVGLPLSLRFPAYPLLLALPAWRARRYGPVVVLADHLAYGAGVLVTLARR
jgi:glycosyltransferase involved in cell wall biosynthesis